MNVVAIDTAHAHLLHGLVCARKPARVLEFGFGAGASAEAILRGLAFNQIDPEYTVVDNFCDWGGVMPAEAARFAGRVRFVEMSEQEFVGHCLQQYDFIMSDADHQHTHEWFGAVYDSLLAPGGVVVYHDVCNEDYPGLCGLPGECRRRGLSHVVFARSSVSGERCERGLLVIFKNP